MDRNAFEFCVISHFVRVGVLFFSPNCFNKYFYRYSLPHQRVWPTLLPWRRPDSVIIRASPATTGALQLHLALVQPNDRPWHKMVPILHRKHGLLNGVSRRPGGIGIRVRVQPMCLWLHLSSDAKHKICKTYVMTQRASVTVLCLSSLFWASVQGLNLRTPLKQMFLQPPALLPI